MDNHLQRKIHQTTSEDQGDQRLRARESMFDVGREEMMRGEVRVVMKCWWQAGPVESGVSLRM